MVDAVLRAFVAAALALAACSNPDNLILGGVSPGPATPLVLFDNINSAISGTVTLTDANGNPTGQSEVVIISDRPNLCAVLKARPSYFRVPTEAYEALILFLPQGYLGTFVIGRGGDADNATSSEIIAAAGPVLSSVLKGPANAGTGTLALSGTPSQVYVKIIIDIDGTGEPGTAKFKYSLDGGTTYSPDVTVPANGLYPLDATGVTVDFKAGAAAPSFAAGDNFTFTLAPVAPFDVLGGGSFIALTQWSDSGGGHATGSFDLFYSNSTIGGVFEFSGRFNTDVCAGLDGVQLP